MSFNSGANLVRWGAKGIVIQYLPSGSRLLMVTKPSDSYFANNLLLLVDASDNPFIFW